MKSPTPDAGPLLPAGLCRPALFLSAAIWIVVILGLAGVLLSPPITAARPRRVRPAPRRLSARAVADVASSGDDQKPIPANWAIRSSISCCPAGTGRSRGSTARTGNPRLALAVRRAAAENCPRKRRPADIGGARSGYATGPDGRRLRIVERQIAVGDNGLYLVQVAATTETISGADPRFEAALAIAFLCWRSDCSASSRSRSSSACARCAQLEAAVADVRAWRAATGGGRLSQ